MGEAVRKWGGWKVLVILLSGELVVGRSGALLALGVSVGLGECQQCKT